MRQMCCYPGLVLNYSVWLLYDLMCPPEERPATEAAYPAIAQLPRRLAAHGAAADGTRAALDNLDDLLVHCVTDHLIQQAHASRNLPRVTI